MLNITLILHNIRSAHNVGAIFRSAEGAGIAKIFLTGYTPAPDDQFERANKEIAKTALGAEQMVKWEKTESATDQISKLKKLNYQIVALEQDEKSVDYKKFNPPAGGGDVALILGNEVGGIEPEILHICDQIIEIPLRGQKESLNVATAAGIAIFRLLDI